MRRSPYDNDTAKKIERLFTEDTCAECGEPFFVTDAEIAHHETEEAMGDRVDHDADADHTPFDRDIGDIEADEAKALAQEWLEEVYEEGSSDLDFASEYADNSDTPEEGILMANWNDVPKHVQTVLERAGYELEWSDCVTACSGCCKVIRTEPTHYGWKRQFWLGDGEILCEKCVADDPSGYLDSLRGNPNAAHTLDSVDLSEHGYVPLWGEFENGFHAGQDDDPKAIAKALKKRGVEDFIFSLDSVGQFDAHFSVWVKATEEECDPLPFVVSVGTDWRGDRLITWREWHTSKGLTEGGPPYGNETDPVIFATVEDAEAHLAFLLVDGKVWFWPNLDPREGKCKVAPNVALDQALRSITLTPGPGIQVTKLSIDPETGEGTATTKLVSPEDFVAGKALE